MEPGTSLGEAAWRVLSGAREEAVQLKAAAIDTDHLLLALALSGDPRTRRALDALGLGIERIRKAVEDSAAAATGDIPRPLPFSAQASAAMESAARAAKLMKAPRPEVEHVLIGVLKVGGRAGDCLEAAGLPVAQARSRALEALGIPRELWPEMGGPGASGGEDLGRSVAEARREAAADRTARPSSRPFPAEELTGVRPPARALGRDRELAKLAELLQRGDRSSVFLIGPEGCGKRALVRACAGQLVEQAGGAEPLRPVYLFEPELAREASPPIFMGEGAVVGRWLAEMLARAEGAVFAFSRFVSDEWVYDDFLEFVIPACVRRWAVCVFLVTIEERRALARRHPELSSVTLEMELAPLAREHALALARERVASWPRGERLAVADTAMEAVVNLAARFLAKSGLPGSALTVLEETRARVRREYAPRVPESEKSIDAVQKEIRQAMERGTFDRAEELRRERDALLREYDDRIEGLLEARGAVVIGTGEIVRTVAELSGRPEAEIRSGGAWDESR